MTYKVGNKIKDGDGNEWVIARIYRQEDGWYDLELINVETGATGELRVK